MDDVGAWRPPRVSIVAVWLGLAGCGAGGSVGTAPETASLEDVFTVVESIRLEEEPTDSIADVGAFLETSTGDLVIADRFKPVVRRYTSAGVLLASAGRHGEGPGEYRSIRGLGEGPGGRIHIVDGIAGRITTLTGDLEFESVWLPPWRPTGSVYALEGGLLVPGVAGRDGDRLHLIGSDGAHRWSGLPPPAELDKPYWRSTASTIVAVAGGRIYAATSILYPIFALDPTGEVVGVLGAAPPSFRPIPEVEYGAFGAGPFGDRFQRWVASFTVIGGIHPVGDSHLAVVHSRLSSEPRALFERRDYAMDVYRLADAAKVYEDVPLPPESRVLGGGRNLYLMTSGPVGGTTIVRLGSVRD